MNESRTFGSLKNDKNSAGSCSCVASTADTDRSDRPTDWVCLGNRRERSLLVILVVAVVCAFVHPRGQRGRRSHWPEITDAEVVSSGKFVLLDGESNPLAWIPT